MAVIRAKEKDTRTTALASPVVSVLNALVREGSRIRHDCGGKALCGTCRIRAAGASGKPDGPIGGLSPIGERERVRLEAVGAAPGERLACQSYAFKDIDIEIINLT